MAPAAALPPAPSGIGLLLVLMRDLRMRNQELSEARAELALSAVAAERERFARDLHDLLGHSLSVIAIKAELAGRLMGLDDERAATEVADVERVARESLREVREAVSGYRQPTLEKELEGARVALSAAGIEAEFERAPVTLDPDVEAVLAWAVREGATNVIRHSGARHCHVTVKAGLADAAVEVVDDGGRLLRRAGPARHGRWPRRPRDRGAQRARGAAARPDRGRPPPRRRWLPPGRVDPGAGGGLVIRVLIAEDQSMVRGALATLLGLEPDIEVVAQVARGDEVLTAARSAQPDIALLDIEMPGATGLDAAEELARELPDCRVLILTTFGRPGYLRRAMEGGASGFVLKDAPAGELSSAIRRALRGERVVDPGLAAAALSQGESPLDPARARGAGRQPRPRHRGRAGRRAVPVAGHRAQPPVLGDAEARRAQPGRGGAGGRGARLAVGVAGAGRGWGIAGGRWRAGRLPCARLGGRTLHVVAIRQNIASVREVRLRGFEPPRARAHTDLNRACIPVSPQPLAAWKLATGTPRGSRPRCGPASHAKL